MGSTYIQFSTNAADWVQLEALYAAQQQREDQVTGANVNKLGLFDQTVRGPDGPRDIGSPAEFEALYGGRDNGGGGNITGLAWKGMLNRKLSYPLTFCRVRASDAVAAHANDAANVIEIVASSVGTWANNASGTGVSFAITAPSNGTSHYFNLVVKYQGAVTTYQNLTVYDASTDSSGVNNATQVIGTSAKNLITLVKLKGGDPTVTSSDINLASGSDGTVALSDYEAAFDAVAAFPGVRVVPCACDAVPTHATFNGYVQTNASQYPLVTFLMWAGANHDPATEITTKASQLTGTKQQNVWWCYNMSTTYDRAGNAISTGAHLDMAAILSNIDVAIHPGSSQCISILSGVKAVANTGLSRGDLILLRRAGICTLEQVDDGFQFHSVVASNSTGDIGDSTAVEGADVRRIQWITESQTRTIAKDVKQVMTESRRRGVIAKLTTFARIDQDQEHVVAPDDPALGKAWRYVFVETPEERARNIAKLMAKTRILPYFLTIVMMLDVGTGVMTVTVTK